jgi:alginate O-acetyltransferase complex protein AlgI
MLFNSIEFAVFLPVVFSLYWILQRRSLSAQNLLILIASYVFYGWWDWRFLAIIVFSTVLDFTIGKLLGKTQKESSRKLLLFASIGVNLGILVFFKYYNFFIDSFTEAFTFFGGSLEPSRLNIILPVGISFYTFQTLSYTVDVYKRKLEPHHVFVSFAAFVSFFPQLVAGPIERASNLLPQFTIKRKFSYSSSVDGLRQVLWGLFKKVVIADNCAEFANLIFDNHEAYGASTLVLGAFFFTFQIYGDFSGYSDIAIGVSRLFGFNLMQNFAYPYFSRDIAEFWRRWHISLSTWFRDYLYIPLGGSKGSMWFKIRNVFIIFLVSGFWHGANWTFIVWGGLNALFFLPLLLANRNRVHTNVVAEGRTLPSIREFLGMLTTFCLTVLAWVFFRAESLNHAFSYLSGIFDATILEKPHFKNMLGAYITIVLIGFLIIIEWIGRRHLFALANLNNQLSRPTRYALYYILTIAIIWFMDKEQEFIYFQF